VLFKHKIKASVLSKLCLIFLFPAIIIPQQSKLSKSVNYISEFIASEYFDQLRNYSTDVALVDSIYLKAVNFNNEDYGEALLSLTFATLPYKKVPIVTPLFKFKIYYPLISSDEKTFNKKNENLPKYLFYDSPQTKYGDKDKLAHFFGNAYIGYSQRILDLSALIGYFVESFEEDFKVDSKIDNRDLDVNWYGDLFGKMLRKNKDVTPSSILLLRSFRYLALFL
jgi:hypothetical protein